MKVVFISYSFKKGGAAIAAAKFSNIANSFSETKLIAQEQAGAFHFLKRLTSYILSKTQYDSNPIKHSLNLFSYQPVLSAFNECHDHLFHIHWVNNDTLSIFDFDKIPQKALISLHDEWFYCGAEHCYKVDDTELDFVKGYRLFKRDIWGIHWNYFIWRIKFKNLSFRKDITYTVPSRWMLSRASQSAILRNADIRLLPNPIDCEMFSPVAQKNLKQFRLSVSVSDDDILLAFGAFGAIGGKANHLKGAHLLESAIRRLSIELPSNIVKKVKLINFGGQKKEHSTLYGFTNISLGHISEQSQLALLYSAADIVVVPSMVESFGQVAAEALACETPVVCFNCSGLKDIVNEQNGLLVKPYSVSDLTRKLKTIILMNNKERLSLGRKGRIHIVDKFSYPVVSKLYQTIINDVNSKKKMKN